MATYSGGLNLRGRLHLDQNTTKEINRLVDNAIAKEVRKVEKMGKQVLEELRTKATLEWFNEYNADSLLNATVYDTSVKQSGEKIVITFTSYIDIDLYKDKPSFDRWMSKYNVNLNGYGGKEAVLALQLYEGLIGLPEKWEHPNPRFGFMEPGSDGKYTNPYYIPHKDDGLQLYLETKLKAKWGNEIVKAYNKLP